MNYARPARADLHGFVRPGAPTVLSFADDGKTPNNPRLPVLLYRDAVQFGRAHDPAAVLEELFAANGWRNSWRDGIYRFLHFHTQSHEVLGVAAGSARVQFGGAKGRLMTIEAGDVVVLPAGTGHQRIDSSADLLVVGAYPAEGTYDEPQPREVDHAEALARIARVPLPQADPIFGKSGPLLKFWPSETG